MHRLTLALVSSLLVLVSACSKGSGPSTPTGPSSSTPTRIINLSGSLAFGSVNVGSSRDATLTITNTGTAPLTVTGMSATGGFPDHSSVSWTQGTIPAGGSQSVNVRFEPRSAGTFSGTLTVNADHTGGVNTIAVSGTGAGVTAAGTWSGRYVVERCDGTGSVQDLFCSANRGLYPAGTSLPLDLVLTQSGSTVSGTAYFGQVTGPVTGVVSSGGTLTLQGTARSSGLTITVTGWSTPINGNSMTGVINFNVGSGSLPGVAAITARLTQVTR
ncbi:hypothetical protein TBR22_A14390 [Luteitalea sp. TBR-22]|uniref:choice-of-anchor D domain-containing protein n=1 Tax=Luteitalea sp. TBR-22 TaxID=2802971 RepID=UPI001AFBAFB1|nr:choice-of-anchor D domain-containing protein [Luteitalea sp. TBR-22]BCS32229.1 hypothetical protein TBR22_A14390 [Luteitalea sp. TBR-22]